ncbi:hypothetical protein LINPERPRIM_LOCUS4891, partial [Linum perenne]
QIRSCEVSFTKSGGRFGSDFKLTVGLNELVHFVFLESSHLLWIEDVLKTAKTSSWRLPQRCILESSRRKIVLARFKARGQSILRISECCANNKVFFVDIPGDSPAGGWSEFLILAQKVIGVPLSSPLILKGRSFADVVGRRSLPMGGNCKVSSINGASRIVISEEGVSERLSFLEKSVVFRFVGAGEVSWPEFRIWASRVWKIPPNSDFLPLGDGLWLLECSSKREEALRFFWMCG